MLLLRPLVAATLFALQPTCVDSVLRVVRDGSAGLETLRTTTFVYYGPSIDRYLDRQFV